MSCAGAWAWGEVPHLLRAAGHEVVAPDLTLRAGVVPAEHAAELVAAADGSADVVAGHSYGAMAALPAAEALGASALVVIDGFVPDDGESAFDLIPERCAPRRAEADARGDGMWTSGIDSAAPGLPDWMARLVPMPISAFEAPVAVRGVSTLRKTFVRCTREPDFAGQAERARQRGWRVVSVPSFHALPLLDPATTAKLLIDASEAPDRFGPG
jgi:pimeloyl-ACP methyl ester carboxylesterase